MKPFTETDTEGNSIEITLVNTKYVEIETDDGMSYATSCIVNIENLYNWLSNVKKEKNL